MNDTVDEASLVTIASSVYARAFGHEMVLLEFGKGEYFGLDPIASEVWRGLESCEPLGAIAGRLTCLYEVSHAEALRDICALVAQLRKYHLLELAVVVEAEKRL